LRDDRNLADYSRDEKKAACEKKTGRNKTGDGKKQEGKNMKGNEEENERKAMNEKRLGLRNIKPLYKKVEFKSTIFQ